MSNQWTMSALGYKNSLQSADVARHRHQILFRGGGTLSCDLSYGVSGGLGFHSIAFIFSLRKLFVILVHNGILEAKLIK